MPVQNISRESMRGQVSIEMIIILAVLLTLVLVVATKLQESAKVRSEQIAVEEEKIKSILSVGCGNRTAGAACTYGSECASCKCTGGYCE